MKIAFLFPGQGSQSVGMGADLAAHVPSSMAVFEEAGLQLGYKLESLCFYGPAERLSQTDVTQPALLTTSVAALRALTERGVVPDAVAGHSVGEYAALVAAGSLDFETALHLVNQRGLVMSRAAANKPGAMAAVLGLESAVVQDICDIISSSGAGMVTPANFNGGGQVVISGESAAVDAASSLLKERGAKRVVPLSVSGAFHSPLMADAASEMSFYLSHTNFEPAKAPVVANATADYETSPEDIQRNLIAQIASPVRWEESVQRLLADGYDTFVEVGNGNVLTGLLRRMSRDATTYNVGTVAGLEEVVSSLAAGRVSGNG